MVVSKALKPIGLIAEIFSGIELESGLKSTSSNLHQFMRVEHNSFLRIAFCVFPSFFYQSKRTPYPVSNTCYTLSVTG